MLRTWKGPKPTTTTILNEKKAAKQKVLKAEKNVKKAKKVLARATKSRSKEKIVEAKVDLQSAQKLAVEAEASAELAGKDQRQAEQAQMAAQAKADSAEMLTQYRDSRFKDRAAKLNWLRIKEMRPKQLTNSPRKRSKAGGGK